ncbi:aromatic ring-hydroxylating dioxygenase subunit alpha, partial [Streptomyces sp. NPDC003832]
VEHRVGVHPLAQVGGHGLGGVREAYGLVFVFPGDPEKAAATALPVLPAFGSRQYKTMTFSRTVRCHYSFMHENLLDMNHQFLHRGVVGKLRPELLEYRTTARSVEAQYLFTHAGGKRNRGAGLLAGEGLGGSNSSDVMTIRTEYPYQTLDLVPENAVRPAFRLWVAYVPKDAEQRTCHAYGLLMIEKPGIPGALHLAWPLIRRFTERVFAEDRMAVEAEQRAWDEQGEDRNHEVFPLILDVREVLRTNGVPLGHGTSACNPASGEGCASASGCRASEPAASAAAEQSVALPDA